MEKYPVLNSVKVHFEDSANDYETDVSAETTEESAKQYFVGKIFDVGKYPSEKMRRCIGITFTDNQSYKDMARKKIEYENIAEKLKDTDGSVYVKTADITIFLEEFHSVNPFMKIEAEYISSAKYRLIVLSGG